MKTTNKTTPRFTINFLEKTISGTKASFDKASKGISPIYEELTTKTNAHPDFELVIKEQKHKTARAKRTYEGMDFKFMEAYINIQVNATVLMNEYKAIVKYANDTKISVYPFVKKWFLGTFDPDKEGFDMAKAKQEISDDRIASVVLNIPTNEEDVA